MIWARRMVGEWNLLRTVAIGISVIELSELVVFLSPKKTLLVYDFIIK